MNTTTSSWSGPPASAKASSPARWLTKLARVDVLVIDDWGLAPVQEQERRDLLEILEDRYGSRSTIVTSQLPPAQWHDHLGEPTGRRHLRSAPPQRPPNRVKRSLTQKGGYARQLIGRPASFRSDHDPDRRVHDGPIWVFSFAGIRREARATWPQVSSEGLRNGGSSCILRSRVGAPRPPESVYRRHEHPLPDRRCPPSKPVAPRDR